MIDPAQAEAIISLYRKHGWLLRRIVTSAPAGELDGFGVPVTVSDIDAAWFSREPGTGGVPWEVRFLGDIPFSLVENIDESEAGFEEQLRKVEQRLRDHIDAKRAA